MQVEQKPLRKLDGEVLLVAASHTGNNIFCTPAIRFLKKHYPDTIFDLVALNKKSAEVFYDNPDIRKLIVTDSKRKLARLAERYSEVICLYSKSVEAVAGIKHLSCVPPLITGVHHAQQVLDFVADYTGYPLSEADRAYSISVSASRSPLGDVGIDNDDLLICMHLGCARTAIHGWKFFYRRQAIHQKLWPVERYIELANRLVAANPGIRFVITGTKNESFLGKKFEKQVPRTINLIGKTAVPELYRLMGEVDLYISQDCGVLHVASASNVPLVGLFGPTNPVNTGPYPIKPQHIVIKKPSMDDIDTAEVAEAALKLLAAFTRKR